MKSYLTAIFLLFSSFCLVSQSHACQWDIDCDVDAHCVRPADGPEGVCMGGSNTGYDNHPARNLYNIQDQRGVPCQMDTDCPSGNCVVGDDADYGTCAN